MNAVAIIFAGGVGSRLGDSEEPKQFREVAGRAIIGYTLDHFERHRSIEAIYVACLPGWERRLEDIAREGRVTKLRQVVPGGATSQDSTRNGLLAARTDWQAETLAVIHDGVRPIITAALIDSLLATASELGNAVTVRPVAETPLTSRDGLVAEELRQRSSSWVAQAPQVFRLGEILAAHEHLRGSDPTYTDVVDSATLMSRAGHAINLVVGNHDNLKITHSSDVDFFRGWLLSRERVEP